LGCYGSWRCQQVLAWRTVEKAKNKAITTWDGSLLWQVDGAEKQKKNQLLMICIGTDKKSKDG
jgi:hypothetical protein